MFKNSLTNINLPWNSVRGKLLMKALIEANTCFITFSDWPSWRKSKWRAKNCCIMTSAPSEVRMSRQCVVKLPKTSSTMRLTSEARFASWRAFNHPSPSWLLTVHEKKGICSIVYIVAIALLQLHQYYNTRSSLMNYRQLHTRTELWSSLASELLAINEYQFHLTAQNANERTRSEMFKNLFWDSQQIVK